MARFARLRSLFKATVFATLSASAAACYGPCPRSEQEVVVDAAESRFAAKYDECIQAGDCDPFCREVIDSAEGDGSAGTREVDCDLVAVDGTSITVAYSYVPYCPGGRRPPNMQTPGGSTAESMPGAWLAELAKLEHASIYAFVQLARELEAHNAPRDLVAGAIQSAWEEVDHAATVADLASRYGARIEQAPVEPSPIRSLEDLALDNAVEGCIRETYGALAATWQAATANNAEVRRAMEQISADETRHAELSHAIDQWTRSLLNDETLARIERAKEHAIAELRRQAAQPVDPELVAELGIPSAEHGLALLDHAATTIWA